MTQTSTSPLIAAMMAGALCLGTARAAPKESLLRIEVARQFADKGEYDKAVEELRLYLSEHPDSPEIFARIGSLRMKQGNFRLAGENYKIALAKDPHLREAREGLAMAYEKAGDKVKAEEERRKLGQSSKLAAGTSGKGREANKSPGSSKPAHPPGPGRAPVASASHAPAAGAAAAGAAVDPGFSPALDSGSSQGPEGLYAQKEFQEALDLYRAGKTDAMAGALRRCLSKSPGHPGAYYLGGVVRYEMGEFGKALFNFKRGLDYPDRGFNAHFYMGLIYRRQERIPEAIAAFEKYLKLSASETGRRQAEAHLAQMRGPAPEAKREGPAQAEAADAAAPGHGEPHDTHGGHGKADPAKPAEPPVPPAPGAPPAKALVLGRDGTLYFLIPDNASPSGKKLTEAYELCKKEKYEKAVNLLKETVLGYGGSDNADAADLDLASVYLRLGLWESARDRLADYLVTGSRDSVRYYDPAQYLTGLAQLGLKDGEKAERALLRIKPGAAEAPTQEEIDYRLVQAAELQKDGKKISAYLDKAYAGSKDPVRKAKLAHQQALLQSKYGKLDKAMDMFRKAMADCKAPELAGICSESQLRLADLAFKKKDYKASMDQYRQFAAKYADHKESAWVHYQMANIYKLTNNFESALNEYKRVIDNYPDSYWASQAKWKREDTIWQKEYEEVLD